MTQLHSFLWLSNTPLYIVYHMFFIRSSVDGHQEIKKKQGIYVYVCVDVELIHFAIQWKLTQYCKVTILQQKI